MSENKNEEWLEKSIADEHIKYFEYSYFKNIEKIGSGAFGSVKKANWKNDDTIYALKSFYQDDLTEVINELKLQRKVDHNENILKFYGITKKMENTNAIILVLEYADSGTLEIYLKDHFNELGWDDKLNLALQLSNAILCLHDCDIIHRDLHARNILVHQKHIKLADFGLSKKIAEASKSISNVRGDLPYIDPKKLCDKNYKSNKKSDVYSVGVIMWQISSGHRPFENMEYTSWEILLGNKRENIIHGTPIEYSNLYKKCWKHGPNERPNMLEVVSALKLIISKRKNISFNNEEEKEKCLKPYTPTLLQSSNNSLNTQNTQQLNSDLIRKENSLNLPIFDTGSTTSINNTVSSINSSVSDSKISEIDVDNLIKSVSEKHDQDVINFEQIKQLISQKILEFDKDTDKLLKWLKQKNRSEYVWLLGLFYYYNIDIINMKEDDNSSNKSFRLFHEASDDFSLAQVYLAKCYSDGYGTEQNKYLAFKSYEKSAVKNESIIGQFYLGYCYEHGIGIEKDEEEAVNWYKKAARNQNKMAKLHLAECYKLGKGVEKDEIKSFKYYKSLAKKEIVDAQYQLGNCFDKGIGTRINKDQANFWYKEAASNGNIIAKDILKRYNKKINNGNIIAKDIIKHYNKKTNIYKQLFKKPLSELTLNLIGKILMKTNYEKGFYYFQKAAENGNKVAQFNLGNAYRIGERIRKNERKAFELYEKSAEQDYIDGKFRLGFCYDKGIGTDINKSRAIKLFEIAARKGHYMAKNSLGSLYEKGEGAEKNLEMAFKYYKEAAEGYIVAKYNLGICYENGIGTECDKYKAFRVYKKLSKRGYSNARYRFAYCYDKGIGVEVDKEMAFKLYEEAAKGGNKFAQNDLGILYEKRKNYNMMAFHWYEEAAKNGNDIALCTLGQWFEYGILENKKDEVKAFKYYKQSAEYGYSNAQYRAANCYHRGIGTKIDIKEAYVLYQKTAKKGNKFAQNILGSLYENGEGTEKNLKMAFYWYKKAAENENEIAQYNLGICYESGKGVTSDANKAFEFYEKSAKRGYLSAQYKVAHCYDKGIGTVINKENACELYKKVVEKGMEKSRVSPSLQAQIRLGTLYENGEGIEKNLGMAFYWYNKAAESESEVALYELGRCYEHGIFVKKDDEKASELYKKSAKQGYEKAQDKVSDYCNKGLDLYEMKNKVYEFTLS